MAHDSGCILCNQPLRFGQVAIQQYILDLHNMTHILDQQRYNYNHFEKRIAMASDDSMEKCQSEMAELTETYAQMLGEFAVAFESPYFAKVELYYPEIAKTLKQCKARVLNAREAKLALG